MGDIALCKKYIKLVDKAHKIEDELLSLDTDMETHEVRVLRERLIDVTLKLDDLSEKVGRKIKIHY